MTGRPAYRPPGSTANKTGIIAGNHITGGSDEFQGVLGTSIFQVFEMYQSLSPCSVCYEIRQLSIRFIKIETRLSNQASLVLHCIIKIASHHVVKEESLFHTLLSRIFGPRDLILFQEVLNPINAEFQRLSVIFGGVSL